MDFERAPWWSDPVTAKMDGLQSISGLTFRETRKPMKTSEPRIYFDILLMLQTGANDDGTPVARNKRVTSTDLAECTPVSGRRPDYNKGRSCQLEMHKIRKCTINENGVRWYQYFPCVLRANNLRFHRIGDSMRAGLSGLPQQGLTNSRRRNPLSQFPLHRQSLLEGLFGDAVRAPYLIGSVYFGAMGYC
jgi:hypothetical protein